MVFIDSMKFMNSSLYKQVWNLTDDDFNYLTEKFWFRNLELLKQKGVYPYDFEISFKRFSEKKLPDKKFFYSSVKDGTTGNNGKKLDGHISDEDYLTYNKIWNEFNMKNMGDYHDHYLKKDVLLLTDIFEKFIDKCFWKIFQTGSLSLFLLSWIEQGCDEKKYLTLICTYSLKRDYEEKLRPLLKYTVKQITNTKFMILQNRQNTYWIVIWIIFMVGQWVVIFLMVSLSG